MSPWEETRKAAIEALSSRELSAYVPEVMNLTGLPIDRVGNVTSDEEGTVYYEQQWYIPGPLANDIHVDRSVFTSETIWPKPNRRITWMGRVPPVVAVAQDHELAMQMAADKNAEDALDVERRNHDVAIQNNYAIELLKANSGADCGDTIEPWWEWWRNFNELGEKSEAPQYSYGTYHYEAHVPCCFGKGTKVSTLVGLVAIEKILAGDRVLAQNPQTGELGYKRVLLTSVRPPSPMRKLTAGGETIPTTRGHRFWQVGRGWQMSKQLETGVQLYTCAAPVAIDNVEDIDDDQAYNLVVEGFHTYFVGEHRLLVHDNSAPPARCSVTVPVSAADRSVDSLQICSFPLDWCQSRSHLSGLKWIWIRTLVSDATKKNLPQRTLRIAEAEEVLRTFSAWLCAPLR